MQSGVLGDSRGIERATAGRTDAAVVGPSAKRRLSLLEFVSDLADLLYLNADCRVTLYQLSQQPRYLCGVRQFCRRSQVFELATRGLGTVEVREATPQQIKVVRDRRFVRHAWRCSQRSEDRCAMLHSRHPVIDGGHLPHEGFE